MRLKPDVTAPPTELDEPDSAAFEKEGKQPGDGPRRGRTADDADAPGRDAYDSHDVGSLASPGAGTKRPASQRMQIHVLIPVYRVE